MTDRLTDADLDAIEQRYPSTEAWEAGLIAMGTRARADVPALLAEVRRLRAELDEERLRVRATATSIKHTDGGYVHADCDDQPDREPIEGIACHVCWLRHPEGECDHD